MAVEELIAKLERCDGPDRELADEVMLKCGWTRARELERGTVMEMWKSPDMQGKAVCWKGEVPNPLASIDAARTLVPEGWVCLSLGQVWGPIVGGGWAWQCKLFNGKAVALAGHGHDPVRSPALALCIAALKARQAQAKDPCQAPTSTPKVITHE